MTEARSEQHSVHRIIDAVGVYFDLKAREIINDRRVAYVVRARHLAMYLVRDLTALSFPSIGAYFGNRDHTTVLSACSKIMALVAEGDAETNRDLAAVRLLLSPAPQHNPQSDVELLKTAAEELERMATRCHHLAGLCEKRMYAILNASARERDHAGELLINVTEPDVVKQPERAP